MNLLFAIQILGITGEAAYPIEEDSKESSKNTKKQPPHLAVQGLLCPRKRRLLNLYFAILRIFTPLTVPLRLLIGRQGQCQRLRGRTVGGLIAALQHLQLTVH